MRVSHHSKELDVEHDLELANPTCIPPSKFFFFLVLHRL